MGLKKIVDDKVFPTEEKWFFAQNCFRAECSVRALRALHWNFNLFRDFQKLTRKACKMRKLSTICKNTLLKSKPEICWSWFSENIKNIWLKLGIGRLVKSEFKLVKLCGELVNWSNLNPNWSNCVENWSIGGLRKRKAPLAAAAAAVSHSWLESTTLLYCIIIYCTNVLYSCVLFCTVIHSWLESTALYCITHHHTALHLQKSTE